RGGGNGNYGFTIKKSFSSAQSPIIDARCWNNDVTSGSIFGAQGASIEDTVIGASPPASWILGAANMRGFAWKRNVTYGGSAPVLDAPLQQGIFVYEDANGIAQSGLQTVTVTTAYTIDSGNLPDNTILVGALSGGIVVSIPAAANRNGRELTCTDTAGAAATHNITLTPATGNINGSST